MIEKFTVDFHQAKVEINRIHAVTGEKETFSTYPTIGFGKVSKNTKPTGLDWFEAVANDWNTPTKNVASSRVVADWGIQTATR